jgi:hypothetical protein
MILLPNQNEGVLEETSTYAKDMSRCNSNDSVYSIGLNQHETISEKLSEMGPPCFLQKDYFEKLFTTELVGRTALTVLFLALVLKKQ